MPLDLEKIYQLAKIQKGSDELSASLNLTMDFIDQIHEVDTQNVQPIYHPLEVFQETRSDTTTPPKDPETYQKNTTDRCENFYLVPQVIE